MSRPEIFRKPIPKAVIDRLAREEFKDKIKFVVDLKRDILAAGGGLHSDAETCLLNDGSQKADLWGASFYLKERADQRFTYTSAINAEKQKDTRSQEIQSPHIRSQVKELAVYFFDSHS